MVHVSHAPVWHTWTQSRGPGIQIPKPRAAITCSLPEIWNWDWETLVLFCLEPQMMLPPELRARMYNRKHRFTWSRNNIYREDQRACGSRERLREHLVPASSPQQAIVHHCPGIPGIPQAPHNQFLFLRKLVSLFATTWMDLSQHGYAFVPFWRKRIHSFHQILKLPIAQKRYQAPVLFNKSLRRMWHYLHNHPYLSERVLWNVYCFILKEKWKYKTPPK